MVARADLRVTYDHRPKVADYHVPQAQRRQAARYHLRTALLARDHDRSDRSHTHTRHHRYFALIGSTCSSCPDASQGNFLVQN